MGLIVDTSVLVQAERQGRSVRDVFIQLAGRGMLCISTVTLAELAHGVARAENDTMRNKRTRFLEASRDSLSVLPVDIAVAIRAGLLNGELKSRGYTVGLADSVIAATALMRGDGVATLNGKHFRVVPGLDVVEL